jgi:hypothetical protein
LHIPDQVKIGPYIYTITYHDELYDSQGQSMWGQVLYETQVIKLLKGISPERQGAVFIHEALHAMAELTGNQLPEEIHTALSVALYSFLRDNDFLKRREDQ